MSKLLLLVLVLTISPGYGLWITYAALLPAVYVLVQEVSGWLRARQEPVPVRLRSFAEMREARLRSGRHGF